MDELLSGGILPVWPWEQVVFFGIVAATLYAMPAWVAILRDSRLVWPVLVVNVGLGWTLIGWVLALAMAVWPRPRPAIQLVHVRADESGDAAPADNG